MSEYETIIYEPGAVTKIIHNQPEIYNVMGPDFEREFLNAIRQFENDDEAKVAVFLSIGRHFAAGHNIANLSKKQSWKPKKSHEMSEADWRKLNDPRKWAFRIWDIKKPIIVGVQGAALAAGAFFAMLHDVVVMGENAYLGFEIGRVSGAGGGFLQMWFGYRKAFEILCSGWNIGAQELYRLGAINKVVPDDQVEKEALHYAEIMSEMPLETLILNKADLKFGMNQMGMRDQLWHNEETNTLSHCADNEREKEFYSIMKKDGMKSALEFRDQPFERYGFSRYKATDI